MRDIIREMLRSPGCLLLALLVLAACPPPSIDACVLAGCSEPGSSTSTDGPPSTGEPGSTTAEPVPTTTADDTSTGTTTSESSSTGEPLPVEPPQIVSAVWTPNPLVEPGKARLEVVTEKADTVAAWLDGQKFALTPAKDAPNVFTGEFSVFSELSDGTYTAKLLPLREAIEGEWTNVDLTVDLLAAGSEAEWDANSDLGTGLAGTILPGPNGDLYEFGTLDPAGQRQCALRRRDIDGKTGPNDVIIVQSGKLCTALDAAIDIDGNLLLLSEVEDMGETLWQLDRHDPWDNSLVVEMNGPSGMKAKAATVGPEGQIVVCGAMSGPLDTDMAIRMENPKDEATFDFVHPQIPDAHWFSEVANDCVFAGSKLVLAGDTVGQYPDAVDKFTRHTTVEVDVMTMQAKWNVAKVFPGPLVNSSAQAIVSDGAGGYITAGHVCEANCFPQIELRQFTPSGNLLTSYRATAKTTPATGIAWHPAGYVIVSAAELVTPDWSGMWAQAWFPGHKLPLWTFSRSYTEGIHMAFDVAVGKSGWVHLVGISELKNSQLVPTFVTVYP